METEFKKLNVLMSHSELSGLVLSFDCPHCKDRVSIPVNLNGGATNQNNQVRWGLIVPDNDWSKATITPSVDRHPSPKTRSNTTCHFSVVDGKCIP